MANGKGKVELYSVLYTYTMEWNELFHRLTSNRDTKTHFTTVGIDRRVGMKKFLCSQNSVITTPNDLALGHQVFLFLHGPRRGTP